MNMEKCVFNKLGLMDELAYYLHILNKNCIKYRNDQTEEMAMTVATSLLVVSNKLSYNIVILKSTVDVLSNSISNIIEKAIPLMDVNNDTPLTVKSLVNSSVFNDGDDMWYEIELGIPLSINISSKQLSTFTINGIVNIELPKLLDILDRLKIFFDDYESRFKEHINMDTINIANSISDRRENPNILTPLLPSEKWVMDIIENDLRVIKNMILALFNDVKTANTLVSRILADMNERILQ